MLFLNPCIWRNSPLAAPRAQSVPLSGDGGDAELIGLAEHGDRLWQLPWARQQLPNAARLRARQDALAASHRGFLPSRRRPSGRDSEDPSLSPPHASARLASCCQRSESREAYVRGRPRQERFTGRLSTEPGGGRHPAGRGHVLQPENRAAAAWGEPDPLQGLGASQAAS